MLHIGTCWTLAGCQLLVLAELVGCLPLKAAAACWMGRFCQSNTTKLVEDRRRCILSLFCSMPKATPVGGSSIVESTSQSAQLQRKSGRPVRQSVSKAHLGVCRPAAIPPLHVCLRVHELPWVGADAPRLELLQAVALQDLRLKASAGPKNPRGS